MGKFDYKDEVARLYFESNHLANQRKITSLEQ